ncbi:MAG: hypothetical protein HC817_06340 [Saprospiraceae bacterium]|nr:hypothetical protein [Saprospiraceae bacterium]
MGIIKRQSIKNSIVSYAAVLVGAISVIFIYPLIDESALGIIQFTINTAILFAPFASFASSYTALRYFPVFKTRTITTIVFQHYDWLYLTDEPNFYRHCLYFS